ALLRAGKRQARRLALEVRDLLQAELPRRALGDRDLVGGRERRRRERDQPVLREALLGLLVGVGGVVRQVLEGLAEERQQRGAGVLGVGVDLPTAHGGERHVLVAEVELGLGVVAGRAE